MTVGALATIASQFPGGALVDAVRAKRLLVGASIAVIALGALIFALFPAAGMIFFAEVLHGSTTGIIVPALAAIGLGLVGHRALGKRLGRNQGFMAFGNAVAAGLMGVLGHFLGPQSIFLAAAALCLPAGFAVSRINGDEIDFARARLARDSKKPREVAKFRELGKNRRLLIFIGCLVLFQLANASVLPLASERLAQEHQSESVLVTSALIVVPQLVTALISIWVARRADDWGRKLLLLAGFAMLPLRALLFALAPSPWYLVAFQILDGLTAVMVGVMTPLVIADVTRGSGRYNLAQGAAGMATGIGAAFSTLVSGYVVQFLGYAIGFSMLAVIGLIGLGTLYWFLPETMPEDWHAGTAARRETDAKS